jgi:hypothetical protein
MECPECGDEWASLAEDYANDGGPEVCPACDAESDDEFWEEY